MMSAVWTRWFEVSVGPSRQWERFGFWSPWSELASVWVTPTPDSLVKAWVSTCGPLPEVGLTRHLLLGPPQMTHHALWAGRVCGPQSSQSSSACLSGAGVLPSTGPGSSVL